MSTLCKHLFLLSLVAYTSASPTHSTLIIPVLTNDEKACAGSFRVYYEMRTKHDIVQEALYIDTYVLGITHMNCCVEECKRGRCAHCEP